ncbi:MAG: phosphatidate cytidylyltransferase [Bacillota bacterium]
MLKKRVISAILGLILLISIIYLGSLPFLAFLTILTGLAAFEMVAFFKEKLKLDKYVFPGFTAAGMLILNEAALNNNLLYIFIFVLVFILYYSFLHIQTIGYENILENIGSRVFALIYISIGFVCLSFLREFNQPPLRTTMALWIVLLVTWATDIGAYFIGIKYGRRPLAPVLSPNKTVMGAVGGIGAAVLVVFIFSVLTGIFSFWTIPAAILLSITAISGDLIESALKRDADIKDSGNILPGHGGILDRFDSMMIVAPVAYLALLILLR